MQSKDELLAAYRAGTLTQKQQTKLEQMIFEGSISLEDLDEFSSIFGYMVQPSEVGDTSALDHQFFAYLSQHQNKPSTKWSWPRLPHPIWRWAMAGAAVLLAFWLGTTLSNRSEIKPMASNSDLMMNELISNDNVSDKIHLVSSIKNKAEGADQKVINALLYALTSDESTNVRLACIETLLDYATLPQVRTGMIRAIPHQSSPTVLAQLADAIRLSGPLETDALRSLIDKNLPPPLLKSMEDVLPTL